MTESISPSNGPRPRGLFVNSPSGQCSIYESGRMFYAAISDSERYQLDYRELQWFDEIPSGYDFYAFNYHLFTMQRLDTRRLRDLPGLKLTFVLEVAPGDPFILCPDHFDAYCVVDPTIRLPHSRVYAFPRPLPRVEHLPAYVDRDVPVIGSFGFATPGKNFHGIVAAAAKEFDRALVRLHIPISSHGDPAGERAEEIVAACRAELRPGIELQLSHDYLSDTELVRWCAENTLNCFFYQRKIPGLAATADQAIMAGRPLLVSDCDTFRHIHPYSRPYPEQSMRDAIADGGEAVAAMQRDWTTEAFLARFEDLLEDRGVFGSSRQRIMTLPLPPPEPGAVLFLNHRQQDCGIQQYGAAIARVLQGSRRYDVQYREVADVGEFYRACGEIRPEAVIYNYGVVTMPWLRSAIIHGVPARHIGILHEFRPGHLVGLGRDLFDHHIVGDPSLLQVNDLVSSTGRLVPEYIGKVPAPEIPTIGSYGFGFADKGFERVVKQVDAEFDSAIIRLHMPRSHFSDADGELAQACLQRCQALISKPGIHLQHSQDFLSLPQLLDFLAGNSINVFFYDLEKNVGISSCADNALAVDRPIAVNRCPMFRHLHDVQPSICIEDRSLREILAAGTEPLRAARDSWRGARVLAEYEAILDRVLSHAADEAPLEACR